MVSSLRVWHEKVAAGNFSILSSRNLTLVNIVCWAVYAASESEACPTGQNCPLAKMGQRWRRVAYGEVDGRKSLEVVVAMVPIPYYLKSIVAWTMFVRHWHCITAPPKSWVLYTGIIWNLPEFKVFLPRKNGYDLPTTHGRSKFGTKIAWFGDGNQFKNLGKMLLQKIGWRIKKTDRFYSHICLSPQKRWAPPETSCCDCCATHL